MCYILSIFLAYMHSGSLGERFVALLTVKLNIKCKVISVKELTLFYDTYIS